MSQTIEQINSELVSASNQLTSAVENKIAEINLAVANAKAELVASLTNGQGEYGLNGADITNTWVDIADLSTVVSFTIFVLSTENSYIQPQEWAFVFHKDTGYSTSVRIDSYAELHVHSNDLFFRVNLDTKTLQVKKTLVTHRTFSIHLKINSGGVAMKPNQTFA